MTSKKSAGKFPATTLLPRILTSLSAAPAGSELRRLNAKPLPGFRCEIRGQEMPASAPNVKNLPAAASVLNLRGNIRKHRVARFAKRAFEPLIVCNVVIGKPVGEFGVARQWIEKYDGASAAFHQFALASRKDDSRVGAPADCTSHIRTATGCRGNFLFESRVRNRVVGATRMRHFVMRAPRWR